MALPWVLLLALGSTAAMSCPKYVCNDPSQAVNTELEPDQCVLYEGDTYYVQPCNSTSGLTYCPAVYESDSFCLPLGPSNAQTAYPGEPCTGDSTCAYGLCEEGLCIANSTASFCSEPEDCNAGLTCRPVGLANINRCELPLTVGNKCQQDSDCINNAGCNNTVCTPYFRQQEGDAIDKCAPTGGNYGWSNFCAGVMCHGSVCLKALNSTGDPPQPCTTHLNCTNSHYSYGNFSLPLYTECQCGMNMNGTAYCGLFPGDEIAVQYYQKLQQWVNSTAITQCHVNRRWSLRCAELFWDAADYAELAYFAYRYWYYPQLYQAESCVLSIFQPYYVLYRQLAESLASCLLFTTLFLV